MKESYSTFMTVQVEYRTDALQACGAAFKGDKVQQLLICGGQEGSETHSPVARKVQPVNSVTPDTQFDR